MLSLTSRYVRTMVKIVACLIVVSTAVLVAAPRAKADIDQVVAAYYPPLMVSAQGDAPGLANEIIQVAAKRAGRDINIEFMPFQRALHRLQNDPTVMMPALFRNPVREEKYEWIAQVHATQLQFMSLKRRIDTLEAARALGAIGVETGASTETFLLERQFKNLVHVGNPDATARMLQSGRVDAWFLTGPLARGVWQRLGFEEALIVGDLVFEQPVFMVCHVNFPPEIIAAYRDAIAQMQADGTIDAILAKYGMISHAANSASLTVPAARSSIMRTPSPGSGRNCWPFRRRNVTAATKAVRLLPSINAWALATPKA